MAPEPDASSAVQHVETAADARALLDRVDTVVFDCDGVLWRGGSVIEGAAETLAELRAMGKQVRFVTNNSTKSRRQYHAKFAKLGVEAREDEIFSSSVSTARYLQSIGFTGKVYCLGDKGLFEELRNVGLTVLGDEDNDKYGAFSLEGTGPITADPEIGAVVCGFDANINYYKIAVAQHAILTHPGCLFIATNTDSTFPAPSRIMPGGGVMVAAIETCTRPVDVVVGKPNTFVLGLMDGVDPARTLMVGDRLNTDILFGNRAGTLTLLVLTGVASRDEVATAPREQTPTYVSESVTVLRCA